MHKLLWIIFILGYQFLSAQINFKESSSDYGVLHKCGGWMVGAGISTTDFNGDGLDDLTLSTNSGEYLSFYINQGASFKELAPLIDNKDEVKQILWTDYDNDGDKDLYISVYGGYNRLYKNMGDLAMHDVTVDAGLPTNLHRGYGAIWGDYDRDGWLDLYFSSRDYNDIFSPQNLNRLYHNNADGTFSEVTFETGTSDMGKIPFCSIFFDYNNDNWPDIFTANDKLSRNSLFENHGRNGFFNISKEAKVDYRMNAMCSMTGDVNQDGLMDLYITNTPIGNKLLINTIDSTSGYNIYSDQTTEYNVIFEGNGWASNFFDADNDEDLDLYVSGSYVGSDAVSSKFYEYHSTLFYTPDIPAFNADTIGSFTNAIGDFNNDGLLDIIVHNNDPFPFYIWNNTSENNNNWIKIKLEGIKSNRDGIGVKLEILNGNEYQIRYTHCGSGFLGQNSSYVHFGCGEKESIEKLKVTWPSGHIDILENLYTNEIHHITEGQTTNGQINIADDVNIVERLISTSTLDTRLNQKIVLSPNPAIDLINIDTVLKIEKIDIITVDGKMIKQFKSNVNKIDLSPLSKGVYMVRIVTNQGICLKRITKINHP